jgi:hypothetical protein
MDTISLDKAIKFLPTISEEINNNSDVGPYDDDGDTRRYGSSAHEIDSLLNVQKSLQEWRRKAYRH